MGVTSDRSDPRLTRGVDEEPTEMAEVYLVLSDEELARGFIRPLRRSYVHVGTPGPRYPLADLTPKDAERYAKYDYAKWEAYPESESPKTGRFWSQAQLDAVGKGCGAVTTMSHALAETYAAKPSFYGATFCAVCQMHRPVGEVGEFVWDGTNERVGT